MTKAENNILLYIQNSEQPVQLAQLEIAFQTQSRRTIQRTIKRLIDNQQIKKIGQGRSTAYTANQSHKSHKQAETQPPTDINYTDYIPLTPASREIIKYLNQPEQTREPISYQLEFLQEYTPNQTYYLSASTREQLKRLGSTNTGQQPAGTFGREIYSRLLIDLSWASSHLEGNTYSKLDTIELIEHGKIAQGKNALETQMILNHKNAIELLIENASELGFNRYTITNLHSALSENLLPNPADEGRIRIHTVEIGKSVYKPISGAKQIENILDIILEKTEKISDPFEQAFFTMVHIPYLQPFADVNKRVSRLAANIPLIKQNYCPLTFLDVPEKAYSAAMLGVYELTRIDLLKDLFIWAYERSSKEYIAIKQSLAEPDPIRLIYRDIIKKTVFEIVTHPDEDAETMIENIIEQQKINRQDKPALKEQINQEIARLHEGVLARYGLTPSQYKTYRRKM
ncbi:Fic family protein [Catenovulum sediminis]|uniref:Fic family protein n=1 Tax=Catenovulum sediminis TaxID=1740262 RepID=A0ABV1RKI0_9ALTE